MKERMEKELQTGRIERACVGKQLLVLVRSDGRTQPACTRPRDRRNGSDDWGLKQREDGNGVQKKFRN